MNDIKKLLDNGLAVVFFANELGSYTSFAVSSDHEDLKLAMEDADEDGHLTDHHTPEQSVSQLADKVFGCGMYSHE